jgi:hypothetical protein
LCRSVFFSVICVLIFILNGFSYPNIRIFLKSFMEFLFPLHLIVGKGKKQKKIINHLKLKVMKTVKLILAINIMLMMCASAVKTQVSEEKTGNEDKTLSPYFFVKSDDSSIDQLPLKETSAEVNISGIIADVKIVQVYENENQRQNSCRQNSGKRTGAKRL